MRAACFFYFKEVRMKGIENLPWRQPMLLLPNHQNALIDALLIAVHAPKKPYFLARADVFANRFLKELFHLLQMLPIYRMRDGRETLVRNRRIFDRCATLLARSETLLLFPEANHSLIRRVRPLSKGFTRIVYHTWELHKGLDILLVPVGVNYVHPAGFPDRVAFYFGEPVSACRTNDAPDARLGALKMRNLIFNCLQGLTTHIPEEMNYDAAIRYLEGREADFTLPQKVNQMLRSREESPVISCLRTRRSTARRIWDGLFWLANFPLICIWRYLVKPRVAEVEFLSSWRLLFGLLAYPPAYLFTFLLLLWFYGWIPALLIPITHVIFNLCYVKFR